MGNKKYKPVQRADGIAIGQLQLSYKWSKVLMGIMFVFAFLLGVWFAAVMLFDVESTLPSANNLSHTLSVIVAVSGSGGLIIYESLRNRSVDGLRLTSFVVTGLAFLLNALNVFYLFVYKVLHETVAPTQQYERMLASLPHPLMITIGCPEQIHPFLAASSWVAVSLVLLALFAVSMMALIESHKKAILDYHDVNDLVITSAHKSDMTDFKNFFTAFYISSSREVQLGFDKLLQESHLDPEVWLIEYFMEQSAKGNFRVALRHGNVVGFLLNSEHLFTIDMLIVRPDQRGTGVGKALMDDFKTRALTENNYRLNTFVREDNVGAREMFEREGWRNLARRGEDLVYSFEKSDMRNAVRWFNVHQNNCGVIPSVENFVPPSPAEIKSLTASVEIV